MPSGMTNTRPGPVGRSSELRCLCGRAFPTPRALHEHGADCPVMQEELALAEAAARAQRSSEGERCG